MSELSKNERFYRRTVPLALLLSAGAVVGNHALHSGKAPAPKAISVLPGRLTINGNVNLHSSPSEDYDSSGDISNSAVSTNIVGVVPEGQSIPVDSPRITESTNGLGEKTVWLGFEDTKEGNAWRWVNATSYIQSESSTAANFLGFVPKGESSNDLSAVLDPPSETSANLSPNGQYEINGQPVAVGIQVPNQDAQLVK